jgi:hypothetical protein
MTSRGGSSGIPFPDSLAGVFVGVIAGGFDGVLAYGLTAGFMFGLTVGLTVGAYFDGPEPSRVRLRIRARTQQIRQGIVAGLPYGIVIGLVGGPLVGLVTGPLVGLAAGLAYVLTNGLMKGLVAPVDVSTAVSPPDLLMIDRKTTVSYWLAYGLAVGLGSKFAGGVMYRPVLGLVFGLTGGLVLGLVLVVVLVLRSGHARQIMGAFPATAWARWMVLSRIYLPLTGRLPWPVMTFLDDAYQRGVLRQVGAVYQFRHARLQDHLVRAYRTRRNR